MRLAPAGTECWCGPLPDMLSSQCLWDSCGGYHQDLELLAWCSDQEALWDGRTATSQGSHTLGTWASPSTLRALCLHCHWPVATFPSLLDIFLPESSVTPFMEASLIMG